MKVQRQKALAKINLTLDIVGKREDGYHELETIMHTVSLHAKVTLLPGEGGVGLWCNLPYVPRDSRNIAYKAALAFFQETGKKGLRSIITGGGDRGDRSGGIQNRHDH